MKHGIKDLIATFTEIPAQDKTEELLKLSQKIMKDIKIMKNGHEAKIDRLEKEIQKLKSKLKGLVEVSKEAMHSSAKGLKRVNGQISMQKE